MAGASLTIVGGNLSAGTVTGGRSCGNGQAFGGGLFLQGNETITLAPGEATETISGVIADQTGSGGTGANAGSGGLILNGAGTLALLAANKFVGGVTIDRGTLESRKLAVESKARLALRATSAPAPGASPRSEA
jgi:autotransporter-associated beta strand protein